jgi:hypothetical protein
MEKMRPKQAADQLPDPPMKPKDIAAGIRALGPITQATIERLGARVELDKKNTITINDRTEEIAELTQKCYFDLAKIPAIFCRISPFLPLPRKELGRSRDTFETEILLAQSSWGKIIFEGKKLSIYEEDAFFAVLTLIAQQKTQVLADDSTTYMYEGPLLPVVKLCGLQAGGSGYKRVLESLDLMIGSKFKVIFNKKNSRGQKKQTISEKFNIITRIKYDSEEKKLTVEINQYFYKYFMPDAAQIIFLDTIRRAQLSSPISKALYRFVKSHKKAENQWPYMEVAASINLNTSLPVRRIKERLASAIKDLIERKILTRESSFQGKTMLRLVRHRSCETSQTMLRKVHATLLVGRP